MEAENPLDAQINYQPRASDVVSLSDVLQERPSHPRQTLRKALHRLAPTCRLLWCKTPWIASTMEKVRLPPFSHNGPGQIHDKAV